MKHSAQQGFALVIIAGLFLAFATIAAALMDRSNATQQLQNEQLTREKVQRISQAILQYSLFNSNKYPCPAGLDIASTAATFGTEVANCHTGTPTGITIMSGSNTIRGAVPFVALVPYGLTLPDAFDAWNNRIIYVVDRAMTTPGSGTASSGATRPTLTEINTSQTFRPPDYLVISYGRDGMGAIPRSSTTVAIACTDPSTVNRQENCDTDLPFIVGPIRTAAGVTNATYFDDILSFYGR